MFRKIGFPSARVLRVGGDLDAVHVAAEHALVVQRDRPDQRRILHRELLHLEVVVGQAPVAVASARKAGRGGRAGVAHVDAAGCGAYARPGPRCGRCSGSRRGAACARRRGRAARPRANFAPPCSVRSSPSVWRRSLSARVPVRHVDHLQLALLALDQASEVNRHPRAPGVAAEAAGLDRQALALADEALGELVAPEGGRAGHEPALGAEDRDVPVPARLEARAHDAARPSRRSDEVTTARRRGEVAVAGTGDRAGRRDGLARSCGSRKRQRAENCRDDCRAAAGRHVATRR